MSDVANEKKKLVQELETYFKKLDVERLYTHPNHKDTKDWLAEVAAIFKNLDETDYQAFKNLRQHLFAVIDRNTRKHAALQIDAFTREKVAEYRRYNFQVEEDKKNSFVARSLRVFLSYSHQDKFLAGNVKKKLEDYFGVEAFLAHDDIDGGEEWEKIIEENLKATDIFIPLLSPNFEGSPYTDQETGMACAYDKKIIPVSIAPGFTPYGFIKKIQALQLKITGEGSFSEWIVFGTEVMKVIAKDNRYEKSVNNSVIRAFGNSRSFDFSKTMVRSILPSFEPFDERQIKQLINAYLENTQIHAEAYAVPDFMRGIVVKYKAKVDKTFAEALLKGEI